MSTIIIITRPKVASRSHDPSPGYELEQQLQNVVDQLRELGYGIEVQKPEET